MANVQYNNESIRRPGTSTCVSHRVAFHGRSVERRSGLLLRQMALENADDSGTELAKTPASVLVKPGWTPGLPHSTGTAAAPGGCNQGPRSMSQEGSDRVPLFLKESRKDNDGWP